MTTRSLVAALAVSLALPACFSSGGKHDASPVQPAPPPPPSVDYSATLASPLGFLPVDAEVVIGLDLDAVRASPWWPAIASQLTVAMGARFNDFKRECGTDPMLTIHGFTAGLKNFQPGPPSGVMVIHGLDRAALMSCMQRASAKAGPGSTIAIDGGTVSIAAKSGDHMTFAFVDASTAVVDVGPSASRAELEGILASKVPLEASAAFTELREHVDFHATLWTVLNGNAKFFDQAAAMGMRPRAVIANATLRNGLALDLRMRLASPDQATQLAQMATGQIGAVRAFVDKLDIVANGPDVVATVQASDQQLTNMLQMAGINLNP